jgi:hypothetical protein
MDLQSLSFDSSPALPNRPTKLASGTQAWPACANGYNAFLIRNADVRGDEMDEFAYYVIDI